ncbi:MAG: UDP-2,3-diacylglucosamine diphosphatase LpxI [Pseudomonadota bacterium]
MLALIAGTGALPKHLVDSADAPPLIAALGRFPPDTLTPDITFRIEHLGTFLNDLRDRGVTEVCFSGALRRHPIEPAEIDAATQPLVPRMASALQQGDDAALRTVLAFFEEAGFAVKAAHDIAPDLLPPAGPLGANAPSEADEADAARAAEVLSSIGGADIGQGCVVYRRQVLAIEGTFGTDWMLESLAQRPDEGTGGVLVKAPKPGQDRRIDLPLVGPTTVDMASRAGLSGIAIEAGGVMMLDPAGTAAAADAAGLFVWVREA